MEAQTEWWQEFFLESVWDYARMAPMEERTHLEVDFILDLLDLEPGARILDVPCGGGRHSLELAARGYQMTSVDITEKFLEDAKGKADERQLDIIWVLRDMRDLPWHESFDGALCFWGSFGYFDDGGNEEFLKSVSPTLKPGARFLLETHTAETLLPIFLQRDWQRYDDMVALQERHFDHVQSRIDAEWTFIRDGDVVTKTSSMRLYTYRELCCLLQEAGFTDCEGVETMGGEPFRFGSRRLTMVATKGAS